MSEDAQTRYRELFERIPIGLYRTAPDGRILDANPALVAMLGYPDRESLLAANVLDFYVNPEVRRHEEALLRREGIVHNLELRLRRRDGTEIWALDTVRAVRDDRGQLLYYEGSLKEITERKRVEEMLREIGLEITAQLNLEELLRFIVIRAMELMEGSAAGLYLYRPERDVLEWAMTVGDHLAPIGAILRRGEGLSGKVWETGEPMIVDDYEHWEGRAAIYEGYPWKAVVGVPVRWGEEFLGVLNVLANPPRTFSPAEAERLSLFATQAAIAIKNAQLFTSLAQERQRLELLSRLAQRFSSSLDVYTLAQHALEDVCAVIGATQGIVVTCTPGSDRLQLVAVSGRSAEWAEALDRQLQITTNAQSLIGWVAAKRQPAIVEDVTTDERWQVVQGFDDWVRSALSVPLISRGELIGALSVYSGSVGFFKEEHRHLVELAAATIAGAIANARLHQETGRRALEQETLSRIVRALNTLDIRGAFPILAEGLRTLTGCDRVSISLVDPGRESFTVTILDSPFPGLEEGTRLPLSATAAVKDIQEGRPHLTPDLSLEADFPAEQVLYRAGFRSRINLPLIVGGRVIGALSLASRLPAAFSKEQVPILQQTADALAISIENSRLFQSEQRRRHEAETLRRAALTLTTTLDPGEVVEQILASLQEVVPYDTASVQLLKGDCLEIVGGRGFPNLEELLGIAFDLQREDNPNREVVRTRAPFIVADVPMVYEEFRRQPHAAAGICSWLGVPMLVGDRLIGMIALDKREPGFYTQEHARLAEAFAAQAAIAIENSRLFQSEREQRELSEALAEAAAAIGGTLDLDEVLTQILEQVGQVVPSDAANVMLIEGDEARIVRWRGYERFGPAAEFISRAVFRVSDVQNLRQMRESGEPIVIPDTATYPGWFHVPEQEWLRSYAGAPIVVRGVVIGYLNVDSATPGFFTQAHLGPLTAFASHAAAAIERARLFQSEREHRELSEALTEAATFVSSTLDLDQVLDRILEQVERVVGGDAFNIMMVENGLARMARWRGYGRLGLEQSMAHFAVPIAEYPLLQKMVERGEPVIVPDTRAEPDWVSREDRTWLCSYIGAPIQVGGLTVGFLNVNGTRCGQFGPAEAQRLQLFARQAAIAVENAQLYRELRNYAEGLEQRVRERTAQLQAQYAWLEAILSSVNDGILVADGEGTVIQANPVARTWLTQVLPSTDAARLRRVVQDLARQAAERPEKVLELGGLDLELKAAPVSGVEGQMAVVVAMHDVSHLKALDRMKSRFVSNVSHELRTPVTTIRLYATLLRQSPPEKWGEYLYALEQEAERQAQLVEDILQISRIEAGRLEVRPQPVALNDLADVVVLRHQVLAESKGLSLECRPAEPGPVAWVDPDQMAQVLNNLVRNAIQYTPEGGRVEVSTGRESVEGRTWAIIRVKDTGIGIPQEELPHIFDRFFRGEKPREMQISGTGLGLAIVKEIVDLHGGRVTVESEVGVGSTFTIWLPPTETPA